MSTAAYLLKSISFKKRPFQQPLYYLGRICPSETSASQFLITEIHVFQLSSNINPLIKYLMI